ncbi:MAG: acetyl-CoA carboxylase, carboxyltransferase subunit beta [Verrucomicrobiales bacterium]
MAIFKKPTFRGSGDKKRDMPEGLWQKCPDCGEVIHELELKKNLRTCPNCNHHFTLTAQERIDCLADPGSFEEQDRTLTSIDALGFKAYAEKIKSCREITGLNEAVVTGRMRIIGHSAMLCVMDFRFLGASMGSAVGEKITRAIETATSEKSAVVIVSASGGARMHEGILSLMQMAKTSGALALHGQAKLPFISVLTHPTTGGVTASFATLGDIILAEPGCMIGFAGPRVIKETTHQELPEGFQTAEFMHEHGLIDMIVERRDLRDRLATLLGYLLP